MSKATSVNPDVLRWARQSLNLQVDEVAESMNKNAETIEAWESGDAFPTYVQLEKLAYKIYERPIALFFFPEPPEDEDLEKSFRTLPGAMLNELPPRICRLLRKAEVLQLNLYEIYRNRNPAKKFVLRELNFSTSISANEMAATVRDYLGIGLYDQQSWSTAGTAMARWREVIENLGIFVFKDSFIPPGRGRSDGRESAYSGFCLHDSEFPVIYINNNKPKSRQIFTLFHELAHLLMHTGGIDTREDDYIESLSGEEKEIEVLCNQFASEFLMPQKDFRKRSINIDERNDTDISSLASYYFVSREAVLRRLLDQGRVDQRYYELKARQWEKEGENINRDSGGNYYLTKSTYLGARYIEEVLLQYHNDQISVEQAADYLGEKVKNVPGFEDWLYRRWADK